MNSFCRKPVFQFFNLILLSLLCFTAQATINLAIELNPDPVQPNETVNVTITVSNSGVASTGSLSLQLVYPEHLNALSNAFISNGGTCPGSNQCNANEFLTWTLGNLAPGASVTVTLPPVVWGGTPEGTLISFDAEVFENGGTVAMVSRNIVVQKTPVFDIGVDESLNPVAPNQTLTYTITYANRSAVSATNTQLSFPLPAGVSFVSASGGGTLNAGVVKWNLQTFPAKTGGRKTVTVDVNSGVTPGSLLEIGAATITGLVNSLSHTSRALAVTRVENSIPLALEIELNPDPVQPNETLQTSLTVGNTSGSTLFGVTLKLRYNEWLNGLSNSFISNGGTCPGSNQCNDNEFLTWTLGNLAPGASVTVTLPPIVWGGTPEGTLVSFDAEVFEDGGTVAMASRNVVVQKTPVFDIAVDESLNPVVPNQTLTYAITYANRSTVSTTNTQLSSPLPAGVSFVSASGGGILNAGVVKWNLQTFPAKTGGRQTVTVDVNSDVIPGSLLEIDAATITGLVNSLSHTSRALAVTRVENSIPLALEIELNPDPVQPNETLQTSLTVGNTSGSTLFGVTLKLRYNEWLNGLSNSFISDGGACPGSNQCNDNEFLTWTLGNLAPGASVTVTLPPVVWGGTPEGTLVSFDAEVSEDGGTVAMASRSVVVQKTPVFDIAVDESLNPVAPDQALTYTISYANRSAVSTTNTQLSFPLPAGVSFVSASGGGTFNAGVVKWNLQTFPAKKGGRKTVTVDVNSGVTLGSLLEIDAATITGIINSLSHTSRALAITRVENSIPLALEIELNPHTVPPNAVQPNETLQTSLTVGNTSGSTLFGVTLRLRYNEWLNGLLNSFISDGGACPGSSQCNDNEFLTWTLGNLASGASVTVTLPPVVWSGTPEGTLISFDAVLREDNGSQILASNTALVGEFVIDSCDNPPPPATLNSPNGTIADATPTYKWNAAPNSSWYQLWVNDSTGNVIKKWYTAAQTNCTSASSCGAGLGTCSITPTTVLASGNAIWWIQTWNSNGTGPWSSRMNFKVGTPPLLPPPPATLISPKSAFGDTTPTYTWDAVASSTWYYLWVNDSTGNIIKKWYTAAQASCASGAGICTITPTTVANGNSRWWIQTWNPAGSGPWSLSLSFITPPSRATLISPSGSISDTTPTYSWNAIAGSTWYYLWVNDSTGNVIRKWYTASQSGCASGSGICSITSATALASGNSTWWIKTWNPGGSGPWSAGKGFFVN